MKGKLSDLMLPAPVGGGFEMEGYWVWCGSVIKGEDGRYHMFASRWPKKYPMHPGWLVASEIVRASCDTPGGTYKFEEVVLPARGPQYWDGRSTHCPQIKKVGDTYVLYYTGMTHPFEDPDESLNTKSPSAVAARASKRTGIATAKSIFGPWERRDEPVLPTRPDKFDSFLTSNATPCINEDGSVVMIYKARSYIKPPYVGNMFGGMYFGAARAEKFDAEYKRLCDTPMFEGEDYEFEDPFIWKDEDGYNMMAKDMRGNICGEEMGGIYASSADGINWNIKENFLFYSRKILWDDGEIREMGNMERPFILFEDGKPTHVFFATSDGKDGAGFTNCTKTWNMVIPLKTN